MQLSLLRGILRTLAFAVMTALLLACFLVAYPLGDRARSLLKRGWSCGTLFILGIRVTRIGEACRSHPTLLVSNHVSYLDIPCIAACTDTLFIAKSEVADWPLFGLLARLTQTLFIKRHWRQAKIQRDQIARVLETGDRILLFGEGTSSDGLDILPVKTSLLSVAEPGITHRTIAVQTITLRYARLRNGEPIDARNAELYAWWGDMELVGHLWRVMTLPGAEIEVIFGSPELSTNIDSRKVLGRHLRTELRQTLKAPLPVGAQEPLGALQPAAETSI